MYVFFRPNINIISKTIFANHKINKTNNKSNKANHKFNKANHKINKTNYKTTLR